MAHRRKTTANPTRREALRRLGLAAVAAYVAPGVLLVNEARATGTSTPSKPETPAPSGAATAASEPPEPAGCTGRPAKAPENATISARDFERAKQAVANGTAKPLNEIWRDFTSSYDGQIIGVEFGGPSNNPVYTFKTISAAGRLETVEVSARTGTITQIVGC